MVLISQRFVLQLQVARRTQLTILSNFCLLLLAPTRISPEGWKSRDEILVVRCSNDLRGSGWVTEMEDESCFVLALNVDDEYRLIIPVDDLSHELSEIRHMHIQLTQQQ